ncbi:MAG: stage III sporulation protein AE [Bacillota bacterium]|nr:stage III sporulation protein AE [Bacillota bacterium]
MKKIIVIFLIIFMLPIAVYAAGTDDNNTDNDISTKINNLYNYISNMKTNYDELNNMDLNSYVKNYIKSGDGKFSVSNLVKALISYSFKEVLASSKIMISIIIIAIVCALLNNLQKAFSNEKLSDIAYFACYSLLIIIIIKSLYISIDLVKDTITQMTDFMAALMPILVMLVASVGGLSEAGLMDPVIIGSINVCARIFNNFIIPLILIGIALQFVNNISIEYKIDKLTKLINQIVLWVQAGLLTITVAILSIRGMTSKTIDQVTMKTAKFAVDNFVPVIGKCLSDAISSIAGYSMLLKNALSSIGLIILLIIIIFPIIKLVIMSLIYKLTAAIIEPISDKRITECVASAGSSLMLLTSCIISVSVMFFIMIAIIASAGKAAIGG